MNPCYQEAVRFRLASIWEDASEFLVFRAERWKINDGFISYFKIIKKATEGCCIFTIICCKRATK